MKTKLITYQEEISKIVLVDNQICSGCLKKFFRKVTTKFGESEYCTKCGKGGIFNRMSYQEFDFFIKKYAPNIHPIWVLHFNNDNLSSIEHLKKMRLDPKKHSRFCCDSTLFLGILHGFFHEYYPNYSHVNHSSKCFAEYVELFIELEEILQKPE
jgi:hypothetical protein